MGFKRFWLTLIIVLSLAVPAYSADIRTGGGHVIYDESSVLAQKPNLKFSGMGISCSNTDSTTSECNVGLSGVPAANYYVAGHMSPAELTNGADWVNCKLSGCLAFDGTNDIVTIAHHTDLNPTGSLSIEAWVKSSYSGSLNQAIVMKYTAALAVYYLNLKGTSCFPEVYVFQTDAIYSTTEGTTSLCDDQWHHVAVTVKGTGSGGDGYVRLYVDGVLVNTGTTAITSIQVEVRDTYIGQKNGDFYFNGNIDDVRIWNTQRTVSEIANNKDAELTGAESGLVGYWKLNEGTGTNAEDDSSGIDQDGTLSGPFDSPPIITSGWHLCKIGAVCGFFDGTNDYAEVRHISDIDAQAFTSQKLTVEAWIKPDINTATMSIVEKFNYTTGYDGFALRMTATGKLQGLITDDASVVNSCTGATTITTGVWHHVEYTWDAATTTAKCILDGAVDATNSATTYNSPTASNVTLKIGADGDDGGALYFDGMIQEVAIWDDSDLSATRASSHYTSPAKLVGTESNLRAVWHYDDGYGVIALQDTDNPQTNSGLDSADCLSTSTPCRTIQHVVDLIPRFFSGNTTVHIASGVYPESISMTGYHPAGEYEITLKGYTNITPNSFTSVATKSGTSTGSNTANFPKDTKSLFNDTTLSQFTSGDTEQLLYIPLTGKYYRIETNVSTSQLSIVGMDSIGAVPYGIYYDKYMATLNGKGLLTTIISIQDSEAINLHDLGITKHYGRGIHVLDSHVSDIIRCSVINSGGGYPIDIDHSLIDNVTHNNVSDNGVGGIADGIRLLSASKIELIANNITNRNGNCGICGYYSSAVRWIRQNLAKGNKYSNFDFEQNFNSYNFEYNRADCNGVADSSGLIVAGTSQINFTYPNTFTSSTGLCGIASLRINSFSQIPTNLQAGTDSDIEIKNGTVGLYVDKTSFCQGSNTTGCNSWTYGGNTTNIRSEGDYLTVSSGNAANPANNNINLYIKENANLYGAAGVAYLKQSLGAHRIYSVTFDPASLSANSTRMETITVTGVAAGDYVLSIKKPSNTAGYIIGNGAYLATDTVYVTVANPTGVASDPASEAWLFLIGTTEQATTTADCALVARMQSGTEATIGIINKDAGCP